MDDHDFLEFGLLINRDDDPVRLAGLIADLQAIPEGAGRDCLIATAERKKIGRYTLYSQQWKDRLYPLARGWCRLHDQRDDYNYILAGLKTLEELKDGKKKTQDFHQSLIEFSGDSNNRELIKSLLRVQEATTQFLETPEGTPKPMKNWSTVRSLKTFWGQPTLPQVTAAADADGVGVGAGTEPEIDNGCAPGNGVAAPANLREPARES